jgi:hypothetical protein
MIKLEATRVIGKCSVCGLPIETFQYYYILRKGLAHDFCCENKIDKEFSKNESEKKIK